MTTKYIFVLYSGNPLWSSGSIDQTRDISGLTYITRYSPLLAAHEWPVSMVNRLIWWTYLLYKLPYFANMLVQIKKINIFCVPILTSIKSYLVFSRMETYYHIRLAVILFVNDTAKYCYVLDWKRTNEYTGRSIFRWIGIPVFNLIRKTITT